MTSIAIDLNNNKVRCNNHHDITVIFNAVIFNVGLTIIIVFASFQEEHETRLHGAV